MNKTTFLPTHIVLYAMGQIVVKVGYNWQINKMASVGEKFDKLFQIFFKKVIDGVCVVCIMRGFFGANRNELKRINKLAKFKLLDFQREAERKLKK